MADPLDVAEGGTIHSKYSGTEIKYNNEEYLIHRKARDVPAVVNK